MKSIIYKGMMEGLSIDRSTRDDAYNMVKHWHPEYEMQFYCEGKRYFFIDNKEYLVKPGSLVLVDSNVVHNTYSNHLIYHDRILLLFEKEKFASPILQQEIDIKRFFQLYGGVIQIPKQDWAYLESLLEEIAKEAAEKNFLYHAAVSMKLEELFLYLSRLKKNGAKEEGTGVQISESNELVTAMIAYLHEHFASVNSLDELSQRFFLNKHYVSRLFKKYTGYTVTEFINIQKIQQAQKLLEDTTDSIACISETVGYDNITYFNKVFKKYVETTPLQYRKKQNAYKKSLREKNNY